MTTSGISQQRRRVGGHLQLVARIRNFKCICVDVVGVTKCAPLSV